MEENKDLVQNRVSSNDGDLKILDIVHVVNINLYS